MVKTAVLLSLVAARLGAADFTLTIGNPIAANIARTKSAALAVRLENCADLSRASLAATAEGQVGGLRRSIPLEPVAAASPGVYAVPQGWPSDGAWVVNLKAACGTARAGAIVPFHAAAFIRESMKMFSRFATPDEISNSLNQLGGTR
jgi:hypothetical protein